MGASEGPLETIASQKEGDVARSEVNAPDTAADAETAQEPSDAVESVETDEEINGMDSQKAPIGSIATAEELLASGKAELKIGDVEAAVESFSEALEKKITSLGGDTAEIQPALARFYLEYGNALLKKAEQSHELFRQDQVNVAPKVDPMKSPTSTPPSREAEDAQEDTVSDEQLAWEVLEVARMCYTVKLKESAFGIEDVEDAAFVHLRLGDLLLVEEQFETAAEEFRKSRDLLKEHGLPYTRCISATIALAQALLCQGAAREALEEFKAALTSVTKYLEGVGGCTPPAERLEDFKATQEDLTIQVEELAKNIEEGIYDQEAKDKPQQPSASSSHPISPPRPHRGLLDLAGVRVAEVTSDGNPFDRPKLESEMGTAAVLQIRSERTRGRCTEVGATEEAAGENSASGGVKKHRIDLSAAFENSANKLKPSE